MLRTSQQGVLSIVRGAAAVASGAAVFQKLALARRPVLVNGAAGVAVDVDGRIYSVAAFTVVEVAIVEIDIVVDRDRLAALEQ